MVFQQFSCNSDFTWKPFSVNSKMQKLPFLTISKALPLDSLVILCICQKYLKLPKSNFWTSRFQVNWVVEKLAYLWNNPCFLERIGNFSIVKLEPDWSLASKILLYFLPSKPWPQGKGRQEGWLNGLRLNKSQQWRHRPRICLELLRPNFGVADIFFPIFRVAVRLQVDAQDLVMTSNLPPNCLLEVEPLKSEKKGWIYFRKMWRSTQCGNFEVFRLLSDFSWKEKIREIKRCT